MGVYIGRWNGLSDNFFPADPSADGEGETVGENIGEEIASRAEGVQAGTSVAEGAPSVNALLPSREGAAEPEPVSEPIDSTTMWIGVGVITVAALLFIMAKD